MVWICRCSRVSIQDVRLVNAPWFTVFLVGCEDVQVRGATLVNPSTTWNGDGLGMDGSRNVTVSDCIIRTGDDCITIKSGETVHPAHCFADGVEVPDCENIVVSNCILSSPCQAIRIGTGAGGRIRHCRFTHIVVTDSNNAILVHPRYGEGSVCISDLHFTDFTLDCTVPFRIVDNPFLREESLESLSSSLASEPSEVLVSDVSLTGLRIRSTRKGELIGRPDAPIRRLLVRDVEWLMVRDPTLDEILARGAFSIPQTIAGQHCAFLAMWLEDSRFEDIRLSWEQPPAEAVTAIDIRHSRDIDLIDLTVEPPGGPQGAALRLVDCSSARIYACRARAGTVTFLAVEESPTNAAIVCHGNDLSRASLPVVSDVQIVDSCNIGLPRRR